MEAHLVDIATYVPPRFLTNADLEKLVDTNDDWIVSRTGIKRRHIASAEETSSFMGNAAAALLLQKIGKTPQDIELILVATMSPDQLCPSNAARIQALLRADQAAAFDLQAACSGFLYGLSVAKAYITSGMYKNVLFIATEKLSSFIDYKDRNTCVLFGDGAAAAWISAEAKGWAIEQVHLGADGAYGDVAAIEAGGALLPASMQTVQEGKHFFRMDGKELFKHAVRRMSQTATRCLENLGLTTADIAFVVPHQANQRILDATAKALGVEADKVYSVLSEYGNTAASSVGLALDDLLRKQPLDTGARLLLLAFGAGLTWGGALLRRL